MTTDALPLRLGSRGGAVRDLRERLAALGFDTGGDAPDEFGPDTEAAVRAFQEKRGVRVDGICGRQTWATVVEAGWRPGDRLIYLTSPMLRGDDVADLQRRLGALGFDAGRVDGTCGPSTVEALQEFQRNAGLTTDGICGPETVAALNRLGRSAGEAPVARIREIENLRRAPRTLDGRRVVVGDDGGLAALADALGRALTSRGAQAIVLHDPDHSSQASQANELGAVVFIGLRGAEISAVAYYGRPGFESVGGRRLAELVVELLPAGLRAPGAAAGTPMTVPVLRETRMPAVQVELGPPSEVVAHSGALADALATAVVRWAASPPEADA